MNMIRQDVLEALTGLFGIGFNVLVVAVVLGAVYFAA